MRIRKLLAMLALALTMIMVVTGGSASAQDMAFRGKDTASGIASKGVDIAGDIFNDIYSKVQNLVGDVFFKGEEVVQVMEGHKETNVIGIPTRINGDASVAVNRCLTISPANGGRTVKLQLYRAETGQYEDVETYTTEDADQATLDITLPIAYQQKYTHTTWRIQVEESDHADAYTSPDFCMTASNLTDAKINAKAACVYSVDDDQVLYAKNMDTRRHQASTTKVMSAIVCMENANLTDSCKVSNIVDQVYGHNVPLKAGETYTIQDMLYSMMLPSNNDAAVVIAENVGGSISGFADMMNQKACELGLANTQFKNPHGLDENGHYSTAYELCKTMAYAYQNEEIRKVLQTPLYKYKCASSKDKEISVGSTDKFLGTVAGFKGGKTGYTDKALYCFTGVYEYEGKTYVISTLGSASDEYRWYDNRQLFKYVKKYANRNA